MDDYTLNIKVEDGELFDGSLKQWEDCFFSFPFHYSLNDKLAQVQSYCRGYNYDLILSFKSNKLEDQKITVTIP